MDRTQDGPWQGIDWRWLASGEMGAKFGAVVDLLVPPGGGYDVYSHAEHERVVYVWDGEGTHHGTGGTTALETDDVLVLPPGTWHGFRNTSDSPTRLWVAWAPDASFPSDDYETAADDADLGGELIKRKLRQATYDLESTPLEKGFDKVGIIWDGAEGSEAICLGWAEFDPEGIHHMHRHPNADEAMCITVGRGIHTTPDRSREMVGTQYDPEFAPAGEWHRFDTGDEHTEGIFFYIGGASLEASGYELREPVGS
jgi:quercetin dioxygenase-like cupin family protein